MQIPTYITKNLIAASSAGIASVTSAAVVTLNTSSLGTARRIVVWGSTSVSGTWTITGTNATGLPLSETVSGSTTGAAVATTQDFLTVTAVSAPTFVSTNGYVGTNTQGGTSWNPIKSWANPVNVGFNVTPTTSSVIASLEYTMDYPSYSTVSGWSGQNPTTGPAATISTACSSVTAATAGNIGFPFAAWRVTLTSSSSGSGSVNASVLQSG